MPRELVALAVRTLALREYSVRSLVWISQCD